jgi:hypothetical protein
MEQKRQKKQIGSTAQCLLGIALNLILEVRIYHFSPDVEKDVLRPKSSLMTQQHLFVVPSSVGESSYYSAILGLWLVRYDSG